MRFTNLDKDFNSHFMTAKTGRPCQNEGYFYILILQGDLAIIRMLYILSFIFVLVIITKQNGAMLSKRK